MKAHEALWIEGAMGEQETTATMGVQEGETSKGRWGKQEEKRQSSQRKRSPGTRESHERGGEGGTGLYRHTRTGRPQNGAGSPCWSPSCLPQQHMRKGFPQRARRPAEGPGTLGLLEAVTRLGRPLPRCTAVALAPGP